MITIDCRDLGAHLRSLRSSLFWQMLDESPDWYFVKDTDSRFLYSNRSHLKHLHMSEEQLIGKHDLELYPAEIAEPFYADETRLFSNRLPLVKVEKNQRPTGERLFMITVKQVIVDKRDGVLGLIGIARRLAAENSAEVASMREVIDELLEHGVGPQATPTQMTALRASLDALMQAN